MDFSGLTRMAARATLEIKKNSPTILFVAGIAGVTTSTVMASMATLKLDKVVNDAQTRLLTINEADAFNELHPEKAIDFDGNSAVQMKAFIYMRLVLDLGRLYGPAIIVGVAGVACLTKSHNILMKRNAALTAAYVTLERTYKAYRAKVRESIGDDKEAELHYEVQKELHEKEALAVEGKKKKKGGTGPSIYSRWFDESCSSFSISPEANVMFLHFQQRAANDRLKAKGFIFLNEVYESVGVPETEAGTVVGWTLDGEGDNYVDFGIFNHHTDEVRNYVKNDGTGAPILLDFNVDGPVSHKLGRL
jgi:hypothetical protein